MLSLLRAILTFITSSSLFSFLDRTLFFRFAGPFLDFILDVADIVATQEEQAAGFGDGFSGRNKRG